MKIPDNLFREISNINSEIISKIIITLIFLFVIWIIRHFIIRIVMSQTDDIRLRYTWQKTLRYLTIIISIILIVVLWLEGFHNLATFLALLSAGIAIALRDVISNVAGWFFIIWVRPITVGDRIELGSHKGDVIDISIFHITLMEIGNWVKSDQSTGRVVNIPNGKIFTEALANYSKGFQYIWNEITVLITFESNWKKAKKILLEIVQNETENISEEAVKRVKESSKRYMIFYSKLTPTVYTSVEESGILLTIRYLCKPRRRRGTQESIWEDILKVFDDCEDIDFAYPTRRLYDNIREGKSETKPRSQNT